jgi:hypothetical protein
MSRQKHKVMQIRLSEEELAKLRSMSRDQDMPMSHILRRFLREAPTHVTSDSFIPEKKA